MFRIIFMLTYLLPGIYLYFCINRLFISRGYKIIFTIIFAALFLIFPVSGFFSSSQSNLFQQVLSKISGYSLPFLLYVFLVVFLYDLFLLMNYFFRWVPVEMRKSFWYRFSFLLSVVTLSVLIVVGGVINLNTIRVSRYEVSVPRKNSRLETLRVAFVADFHIHRNIPFSFVEQFVGKVEDLNPDLMLYGGDIVDDRNVHPEQDKLIDLFRQIEPRFGVFGVLGNHEFYRGHADGNFFKQAGIVLLNDSLVQVGDDFIISGRLDEHFRDRKPVKEILGENLLKLPVLMIDHRPTSFDEVSQFPVDAHFSGHTHNGQLFPLNFILKGMYELAWGYKKKMNTHFFVTSGLRLWGPPVKTTGKSEIMVIDFKFE